MAKAEFTLQEKDRARFVKDRAVRFAVSCGGVGVLAALVLIFIYLAMVIIPLFSDAKLEPNIAHIPYQGAPLSAINIDDYGEKALTIANDGKVSFWNMQTGQQLRSEQLVQNPVHFSASLPANGWYGFVDQLGEVTLFQPKFNTALSGSEQLPETHRFESSLDLNLATSGDAVRDFAFGLASDSPTLAWQNTQGEVWVRWLDANGDNQSFRFPAQTDSLDQMLLTPNGATLYLRYGSTLAIAKKQQRQFDVREVVDLSQNDATNPVQSMTFLSGAYSLLVTQQDGQVTQWFDASRDHRAKLTPVRTFYLASDLKFLLPDTHRKGFYGFFTNGTVQSYYTTSEKLVLFSRAYQKAPQLAAMSNNERFLVAALPDQLTVAAVDNPYPEISFSSLWHKVWYEGYSEPDFVWQSTSAGDDFEPKFSLVPITFGTLKAAAFAMLFSVPMAVLGAIYTAYFMSPRMRRVVKPSIELMEALPTVIIGFLAGLWLAPIIENNFIAFVLMLIVMPLVTLIIGALWSLLPLRLRHRMPNGWHALILMPLVILLLITCVYVAPMIEVFWFGGDVRLFLTDHGFNFEQRNALVVGLAMGFAVIPTIFTIAEDAIFSVPKHLSDGSLALGATPWQTLIHVVLLTASPGIFSAIMMGLGRAVGETMIVLMATGNTPLIDWNILEGMRTLSATIAVELPESAVGSAHYRLLFLAALLLFVFTFLVNSIAEWVRQRLRDKYRAL
ncbi:ABC transporter permease subunit [Vibrio sp. SM6]|uniref:ABC transporter permease subunit n=1 Tax=Vibrio agarilyticus TaxID=2726741 RepID=A0A7X8TSY9_9VIBR|nr:ABC transporter permease subunit [Vibrio agarilyticus]NLS14256.1 ABC transporter permease subunit [Vibrio agarilyticus]